MMRMTLCFMMIAGASLPGVGVAASHEDILRRDDLAAYHGWIKYLLFEAEHAGERFPDQPDVAREKRRRLEEWTRRILQNPKVLQDLRGVQEWAYESPADGSGQPFWFNIPTDYEPGRAFPASLYMHGYSNGHDERTPGMEDSPGLFDVSVLGRARGGWYRALSEADVLHVLRYLEANWNIDPSRVHLCGGSMGGGGAFRLGSRYPHRFASVRTVCGFASDKPVGNLLTLPVYATHSDDDYVVSVLHSRGPLGRLREMGGQVIYDETTGYGHAVWEYAEGNARAGAWYGEQVRPASRNVRRIDYTALDGTATRGWWAEVAEWGPRPRPARFRLTVGAGNALHATLTNVRCLKLLLAESPLDRARELSISVNGNVPVRRPPPLPDAVYLTKDDETWTLEERGPQAPYVLHRPGGANQLYHGEPLLIVYGTGGSPEAQAAMRDAAAVASRSGDATWQRPNGEKRSDGISHNQLLYGDLRTTADTDVTEDDIARCHLVLIGSADQNAVVARIADRLPVAYGKGTVSFNDGFEVPADDTALGLLHYNPDSPEKLIFWVASHDPRVYAADSLIPSMMGTWTWAIGVTGTDCVVARASTGALVASRSFDSRWTWAGARDDSPLLPGTIRTGRDLANTISEVVRVASGSDLAVAGATGGKDDPPFAPGIARLSDLLNQDNVYFNPVNTMLMTGAQLLEADRKLARSTVWLYPAPDPKTIDANRSYQVALPSSLLSPFTRAATMAPAGYRVTDMDLADEMERRFPSLLLQLLHESER